MHKTGISIFAVCAFLGSAMAHAHGGHDPLFSQAWLSWEHGLAHVLAHAWAVPVLATGLALAGGWLLFRLRGGWVGLFVRRVRVNFSCLLQLTFRRSKMKLQPGKHTLSNVEL